MTICDYFEAITAFATLFGLLFVIRQLRHADKVRTLETQTQLAMHSFSVLKHINTTDDAFGFVFGGADFPDSSNAHAKATADITAQMILDLFEHACLQMPTLKRETASAWRHWIRDVFNGSPSVQRSYALRTRWYSATLRKILDPELGAAQASTTIHSPTEA